jgi:predicted enzyme related to lactoylglutathione lyase
LARYSGRTIISYAGARQRAVVAEVSFVSRKQPLTSIGQPVPELPVTDVERAQQHYRDALGFEIGWLDPGEIGAVSRGNVAIFFRKTTPPFEAAVHWVFAEDIDATYNELKSLGANIVEPLEKKPWGLRQFTVEDIDGNRFYFHHD